ncbi:MAG: ABC-F family ATP-binding cassette domain-containing protein [Vicinamibacterales bacterium]
MIQLSSLSKRFGERVLLDRVTWYVGDRDRVGLCGPNGAGKTTLLRILAGLDEADSGEVIRPTALTIGYLPQDGLTHAGRTVFAEASDALKPLLDLKAEMHDLEHRLADAGVPAAEHEALLERYSTAQERFRMGDGYSIELRVATILRGLGFAAEDFERPAEHLSGGWQMRLALAKLLLREPGLLLLDEPTNHLDLDARNWLEEYLGRYPHAVILVSHDRYFLDAVVARIADLSLRTITDYACNYSEYLVQRHERVERLREAKRRQDEEIERVQQFIDRFRYQATKAAQVQSRVKMLEKIERIEVPPERKRIHFQFPAAARSGRMVLELKGLRKAYGTKVVLDGIDLHVERGDRVALVGPNGAGKSTLMRMLAGVEPPDAGTRVEGHQVVMQYFAQDEATRLDPARTVYETLSAGSPMHMVPAIRNILGGFLFAGDDVYKKAGVLSGGERTRLAVARMLLLPSNTLVLDEPTNHLDLDSKDVLLDALEDYGGTLVFVSHDRYFVERLATKVVEVGGGRAELYPGTYAEFLWRKQQGGAHAPASPAPARSTPARSTPAAPPRPAASRPPVAPVDKAAEHDARKREAADRKKRERAFQALGRRIAELEARIAERETAVKTAEAAMAAPGFYDDRDAAKAVLDRHQALMWEVGELLGQWEMLQAEAEEMKATLPA